VVLSRLKWLIASLELFYQYPEGKLSRAEKEILDRIVGQFHQSRYGELIEYAHVHCPEWHNPGGTSEPISLEDILNALGRTPEQIEWILEENKAFEKEAPFIPQGARTSSRSLSVAGTLALTS
jgi:hypothetical protein